MASIVYGYFGTSVPAPGAGSASAHPSNLSTPELLFGYDEDRTRADLAYIDANRSMIEAVSDRADDMRRDALLKNPTDAFLDRVEQQRQAIMADPMHEICERIMLSRRAQWSLMAVHHSALVIEFVARLHQAGIFRQHTLAEKS